MLSHGFAYDPCADSDDQAGFFRQGNKACRQYHSFRRMLPAHQAFHAGQFARQRMHARLVIQLEFIAFNCMPQITFQMHALDDAFIQCGREELRIVAADLLGLVHRGIGMPHQHIDVVAIFRIDRDAYAAGYIQLHPIDHMHLLDQGNQPLFDQLADFLGADDIVEDDDEFIATEAADRIAIAYCFGQTLRDGNQQTIADVVPHRIVDILEAV